MTHLKIEQAADISNIETVSAQILQKLYEVASESTLDNTSDLRGRLHVSLGNRTIVEWLRAHFPNLTIDVDNYAIAFEDPNMLAYLQNTMGIGATSGVITETEAAAATSVANSTNTSITKFNELKYFTNVTESRGGFNINGSGDISFAGWTALQEIDISNFTSIGHKNNWNTNDRFYGCTALKKVTASSRLTALGSSAFQNCKNLEDITGLSGTITLCDNAFYGCKKLKSSNFSNCSIFFDGENLVRQFRECFALTTVPLSSSNTVIPQEAFYLCTGLLSITIPEGVTTIKPNAFGTCTNLSSITLPSTLITVEHEAFQLCSNLAISPIDIARLTSIGYVAFLSTNTSGAITFNSQLSDLGYAAFRSTKVTSVDLSNTNFTKIQNEVFRDCKSLTAVTLPLSTTDIGGWCFSGCSNLTSINLNNVTKLEESALFGTPIQIAPQDITQLIYVDSNALTGTNISGDLVLPNLTKLGAWALSYNPLITSVDLTGSLLETLERCTFEKDTSMDHVILPASLTAFDGWGHFSQCPLRWIKFLGTTVPTVATGQTILYTGLSNTVKIYVPDSALTDYRTNSLWSVYASNIFPMSQFPTDFPNG